MSGCRPQPPRPETSLRGCTTWPDGSRRGVLLDSAVVADGHQTWNVVRAAVLAFLKTAVAASPGASTTGTVTRCRPRTAETRDVAPEGAPPERDGRRRAAQQNSAVAAGGHQTWKGVPRCLVGCAQGSGRCGPGCLASWTWRVAGGLIHRTRKGHSEGDLNGEGIAEGRCRTRTLKLTKPSVAALPRVFAD